MSAATARPKSGARPGRMSISSGKASRVKMARPRRQNINNIERAASAAAGSVLGLLGLRRRDATGLLLMGAGGALLYRAASAHCPAYHALDLSTATAAQRARPTGVTFTQCVTIDRPAEELYSCWRDYENLPKFMTHLQSVEARENWLTHWVADAPRLLGGRVEWDAVTTIDDKNRRIAWRSLPSSLIEHHGSVEFLPAGNRGATVRVNMHYEPLFGRLGKWGAKLFGKSPEQQIHEDLRNFKRRIEVGELPTIEGQPRGSCLSG